MRLRAASDVEAPLHPRQGTTICVAHMPTSTHNHAQLNCMLVCRAWRHLLTAPSPAWASIHLPIPRTCLSWTARTHDNSAAAAWFAPRAACIHTFVDHRLYTPPVIPRALLAHNPGCLHTLDVVALQPATIWPLVARCLRLTRLRLHIVGPWNTDDGTVLHTLSRLTALTCLELGGAELLCPRDVPVDALLRLRSLTLHVPVVHEHAMGSRLTNLQSLSLPELYCGEALMQHLPSTLTNLRIDAWRPLCAQTTEPLADVVALLTAPPTAPNMVTSAAVLAALPNLVVLHLGGHHGELRLVESPEALLLLSNALSSLTALTSLALRRCGLQDIPHGIQSLKRLRDLDLRHNHLRGVPGWVVDLPALKCVRLERQQRGFSLVLPLALAARRGLSLQVAPVVEPLVGGGSRLRLVVRLVSTCGETLCHLTLVGGRKHSSWRGLRVACGGQRSAGGWRASLRPGDSGQHVAGGGNCECSGCTRRDCYAALRNVLVVHDDYFR